MTDLKAKFEETKAALLTPAAEGEDPELRRLRSENTVLRAALANSKDPCIYCGKLADALAECDYGFPGCSRADDMMGCPDFGALLEVETLRKERDEAVARADRSERQAADVRLSALERTLELGKMTEAYIAAETRARKLEAERLRGAFGPDVAELERWRQLHTAIIDMDGRPDNWPEHGNPQLAIASLYALMKVEKRTLMERVEKAEAEGTFQARVKPWLDHCFGPEIAADKIERNDRFLEESLELVQAAGLTRDRAHALVDYVFNRPAGEMGQEIGGVMNTLAALCLAHGMDMHEAAEVELKRVWAKADVIREKQKAKPKGSALPSAETGLDRIAAERRRQIEVERFTADGDDGYLNGELLSAAIVYAQHTLMDDRSRPIARPDGWPWSDRWWKPSTKIRNLEKAGSMIAAEIDRLIRAEARAKREASGE